MKRLHKMSGQTIFKIAAPSCLVLLLLLVNQGATAGVSHQRVLLTKPPHKKIKNKRMQKARRANRIKQRLMRQQRRRVKKAIRKYSNKAKPRHRKARNKQALNRKRTKQKGEPFFVFRFAKWSAQKTGQLLHTTAALMIVPFAILSKLD